MEIGLTSSGYSQVGVAAIYFYALLTMACNAKPNSRPLRWLTSQADDTEQWSADDSTTDQQTNFDQTLRPPSTTNPTNLIPKVDGLSFVNEFPRVLRFSAGKEMQTTYGIMGTGELSEDDDVEGKKCPDDETSGKHNLQGVVAGVSFAGGLIFSMSVCLICCRVRRRLASRMFDQQQLSEASISTLTVSLEPSDVKAAEASSSAAATTTTTAAS